MTSINKNTTTLPVFVINLDSAMDRYMTFKNQAMLKNREFIRWSATPGKDLDSSKFGIQESYDGIFITGFREWSKNSSSICCPMIPLILNLKIFFIKSSEKS